MRKLLLIFLIVSSGVVLHAQRVQSSCQASDRIRAMYQEDADRLALRLTFEKKTPFMDSARIYKIWSDSILNALVAVHNLDSFPARDSIIDLIKIHSFSNPSLKRFFMAADSTLFWMKMLQFNQFPTKIDSVDFLLNKYRIKVLRYYIVNTEPYHIIVFESEGNYNFEVISNLFDSLGGVYYSNIYKYSGDGNDINVRLDTTFMDLTYSYGWDDCIASCQKRRYWTFRVFNDCSVEYLGSKGNAYFANIKTVRNEKINIHPNPVKDKIEIDGLFSRYKYLIYNSLGQLFAEGQNDLPQINGLGNLPRGIYFLKIMEDSKVTTFKLIKD